MLEAAQPWVQLYLEWNRWTRRNLSMIFEVLQLFFLWNNSCHIHSRPEANKWNNIERQNTTEQTDLDVGFICYALNKVHLTIIYLEHLECNNVLRRYNSIPGNLGYGGNSIFLVIPSSCCYRLIKIYRYRPVHRCGPGGSMRACHTAGPGSIPGRDRFPW